MNENFDLICFNFQQRIIDAFNEEENIPFQLKFYLFKEIWETIEETKIKKDYETRMLNSQSKKTLVSEISVPEELMKSKE